MKTLQFKDYKNLNENLTLEGFLKPTRENIESFGLDYSKVTHNKDGTIDYDGDVVLENRNLTQIPFKFNAINGYFDCSNNNLISLKGCPNIVLGTFYCSHNKLTTLMDGPKEVEGDIWCHDNNLIILNDYGRGYTFDWRWITNNPIVIDRADMGWNPYWADIKIHEKFKSGLPYIWDEILNVKEFGKILEKIIELEMTMDYPEKILELTEKFNVDLRKYFDANTIRILKSKARTNADIGFSF